jgi:rRNA-processing protein FCF1
LLQHQLDCIIVRFADKPYGTYALRGCLQNKLEMIKAMMDCLLAKATPCITDCVIAELEKLGPKYRIALRLAKVSS